MIRVKYGLLALAAGFMVQGLLPAPAQALPLAKSGITVKQDGVTEVRRYRRGFGKHHFGKRHFGKRRFHGRHWGYRRHHRRFRPRIYFGPSYYYGYRSYGYHNRCRWLKRRAIVTGSHYWWRRYNRCRYRSYY